MRVAADTRIDQLIIQSSLHLRVRRTIPTDWRHALWIDVSRGRRTYKPITVRQGRAEQYVVLQLTSVGRKGRGSKAAAGLDHLRQGRLDEVKGPNRTSRGSGSYKDAGVISIAVRRGLMSETLPGAVWGGGCDDLRQSRVCSRPLFRLPDHFWRGGVVHARSCGQTPDAHQISRHYQGDMLVDLPANHDRRLTTLLALGAHLSLRSSLRQCNYVLTAQGPSILKMTVIPVMPTNVSPNMYRSRLWRRISRRRFSV